VAAVFGGDQDLERAQDVRRWSGVCEPGLD
jgi:hypothetical protein